MFQLQKILVPTDFSEGSRAAMTYACMLAKKMNGTLTVLYVLESPYHLTTDVILAGPENKNMSVLEYIRKDAEKQLSKFTAPFIQDYPALSITKEIEVGSSSEQILKLAQEKKIDLVVMSTHGRTGVAHAIMGSVAEKVVRQSTCPVLTIKSGQG